MVTNGTRGHVNFERGRRAYAHSTPPPPQSVPDVVVLFNPSSVASRLSPQASDNYVQQNLCVCSSCAAETKSCLSTTVMALPGSLLRNRP